jgi:drug/metabolite transporter (DMT)-like permease
MTTYLLVTILCLVWGATWVVIKIGLEDSPPFLSAGLRFVIAVVVLGIIVVAGRKPQPRGRLTWWRVLLPGIFMYFIPYAAVYYAEQHISAALASILFATFPFFVASMAHFVLPGERINGIKALGLFLGFAGVVVIFRDGLMVPDPQILPSMGLALLSPLSSAFAAVWLKKYLTEVNSFSATFWQMIVGIVFLLPLGLAVEHMADFHWTVRAVGAAAFLGVFGSALTFVIYLHLLKTEEATKLSLIAFVTPIVTLIIGWIVLGESLTPVTMLGGALVLLGVYCVLVWAPHRTASQ